MRINVYSQELTDEVIYTSKKSNTGRTYSAVQLILHSSDKLHHPPADDDRSAITFWMPGSIDRREAMAIAFERIAELFRKAPLEHQTFAQKLAARTNSLLEQDAASKPT